MSDEVLVKVENVSKKFCKDLRTSLKYGMTDLAGEIFGKKHGEKLRPMEFWATNNISFELKRGDCLGLIGRNGAGKTTLLRILNGLIKPDKGRIEMRGRIGALIALGAGFNPILTGRENILVNASVLGLTKKEIDAKMDEIIDFAEIGEFIDSPVQNYSSGMQVRLGFAVATTLEPDILLLDEVLAVGDAAFRNKCYQRISTIKKDAAVIFVSHQMDHIARICNIALVMSKGNSVYTGDVENGVKEYDNLNETGLNIEGSFLNFTSPITSFSLEVLSSSINLGDDFTFRIICQSNNESDNVSVRIAFYAQDGSMCAGTDIKGSQYDIQLNFGKNSWNIILSELSLKRGKYLIGLNILDKNGDIIVWSYKEKEVIINHSEYGTGIIYQPKCKNWALIK